MVMAWLVPQGPTTVLVGEFDALLDHQCACALERKAVGALMVFGRSLDSGEFPARRELFAIRRKAEFEGRARVDAQPGPCVKLDFRRTRGRPRTGTRDSWRAGRGRRQRTGCSRDPKDPRDAHTRMLRRPMPDAVRPGHHTTRLALSCSLPRAARWQDALRKSAHRPQGTS